MLDAACPGQVFTSPTPDQMLAAAQAVDSGAGVLFIVKNYSGDMMNFQMAAEMLDRENATVIVNDDVAVENSTYTTGRRGVAGTLIVEKIVGAAAERGDSAGGAEGARRRGQQGHRVDGRGADLVHRAGGRQADLPDRRRRDGNGRRHPRRAGPAPRQARQRRRHRRRADRRDPERPVAEGRAGGDPARQRLRRHAAARALPDGQRRAQGARRRRREGGAPPDRAVRHLAGDGRLLDHRDRGRRAALALWDAPVHTAALRWGI